MADLVKIPGAATGLNTPDGTVSVIERIGRQNDLIMSQLHGKMYEQALRLNMFFAGNQAEVTTTVGLTTTYTGLCLNNPAGNVKNLVPRQIGMVITTAPAAISSLGIGGGYAAGGVTAHGTPLVPYSCMLGNGQAAVGLADDGCTLVGTPLLIMPLMAADDDAAIFAHGPAAVDLDGSIIIPPGGYIFVYTDTVVIGFFSISWEEVPA